MQYAIYMILQTDGKKDDIEQGVKNLVNIVEQGYEIESAVSHYNAIHYVLKGKNAITKAVMNQIKPEHIL